MTQSPTPNTPAPERAQLPQFSLDYNIGQFVNTMTGEIEPRLDGVVLDYREDRVLWPPFTGRAERPMCVNGSELGPCETCNYALWENGQPPVCTEEVSLLIAQGPILSVLTARRSMMRPVLQWIGMMAASGVPLYAQKVSVSMVAAPPRPGEGATYRLGLRPGDLLDQDAQRLMMRLRETAKPLFQALHVAEVKRA